MYFLFLISDNLIRRQIQVTIFSPTIFSTRMKCQRTVPRISQLFPIRVLDMQSDLLAADISQQILFLRSKQLFHFPQTSPAMVEQLISSWNSQRSRRFANTKQRRTQDITNLLTTVGYRYFSSPLSQFT